MIANGFRDIHYMVDLGAKCATQHVFIPCQPPLPGDPVLSAPSECGRDSDSVGFGGTMKGAVHK